MRFGRFSAITCVARMCASSLGAATEGKRAEAADRAGVAVGDGVGRARQHHAEFRRDHVGNALLGIVDIEKPDAVAAAAFAHRLEKGRTRRIGGVVAAGPGGDGVVLHREGEIRTAHPPLLLLQLLEGVRRVQLVQHVAVDIDEVAAVGAPCDQVGIPDLVEQSLGHDGVARGLPRNCIPDAKKMHPRASTRGCSGHKPAPQASLMFFNGKLRTGLPVAAWMALSTAGATTQIVGSPTPPQKSWLGTSTVSTFGISASRMIS